MHNHTASQPGPNSALPRQEVNARHHPPDTNETTKAIQEKIVRAVDENLKGQNNN